MSCRVSTEPSTSRPRISKANLISGCVSSLSSTSAAGSVRAALKRSSARRRANEVEVKVRTGFRDLHPAQITGWCFISGLGVSFYLVLFLIVPEGGGGSGAQEGSGALDVSQPRGRAWLSLVVLHTLSLVAAVACLLVLTDSDPSDRRDYRPRTREEKRRARFCEKCEHFVVERTKHCDACNFCVDLDSTHCKECQRCVREWDHHCYWSNGDVGEPNLAWFFVTLAFTEIWILVYVASMIYALAAVCEAGGARLWLLVVLLPVVFVGLAAAVFVSHVNFQHWSLLAQGKTLYQARVEAASKERARVRESRRRNRNGEKRGGSSAQVDVSS